MTEDDYDYGVRLTDGTMYLKDVSLDYAQNEAADYNTWSAPLTTHSARVVRAPIRDWEEFE